MGFDQQGMFDKLSLSRLMLNPKELNNQQIQGRAPMTRAATMQNPMSPGPAPMRAAVMPGPSPSPAPRQAPPPRMAFDPAKEGKYEGAFDYLNGGINGDQYIQNQGQWTGGEGGSYQDNFVDTRDHGIFKDAVSMTGRDYGNESAVGHGPGYQLNYEKLPNQGMTKFGRIDQVYQVKGLGDVLNPNAVEWDDNYGWVTSLKNRKPRFADKFGPMIASLAMGGLMGAALPAGALATGVKTAFNLAPNVAKGNYQNALMGLAGSALGSFGQSMNMPSWFTPAAKAGLSLANMHRGR